MRPDPPKSPCLGADRLVSNLQKPGSAPSFSASSQLMLSSSSLSSDDCGLKVAENEDEPFRGGGAAGKISAQFFGNISMMAWMMPTRPHQSECFARTGRMHSSPIICHTLIWNWNAVLRAFEIRGPCAWTGTCFLRVFLILDRKASTAFSHWAQAAVWVTCSRWTTGSL